MKGNGYPTRMLVPTMTIPLRCFCCCLGFPLTVPSCRERNEGWCSICAAVDVLVLVNTSLVLLDPTACSNKARCSGWSGPSKMVFRTSNSASAKVTLGIDARWPTKCLANTAPSLRTTRRVLLRFLHETGQAIGGLDRTHGD